MRLINPLHKGRGGVREERSYIWAPARALIPAYKYITCLYRPKKEESWEWKGRGRCAWEGHGRGIGESHTNNTNWRRRRRRDWRRWRREESDQRNWRKKRKKRRRNHRRKWKKMLREGGFTKIGFTITPVCLQQTPWSSVYGMRDLNDSPTIYLLPAPLIPSLLLLPSPSFSCSSILFSWAAKIELIQHLNHFGGIGRLGRLGNIRLQYSYYCLIIIKLVAKCESAAQIVSH